MFSLENGRWQAAISSPMCMLVYVHVCTFLCVYVCVCARACVCVHCVYMCVHVFACIIEYQCVYKPGLKECNERGIIALCRAGMLCSTF